jgi:hypothetical protein
MPPSDRFAFGPGGFDVSASVENRGSSGEVFDPRADVAQRHGQARCPDVGWLDEMGINIDYRRDALDNLIPIDG